MEKNKTIGKALLKFLLVAAAIFLLAYNSVYFKKLSSMKKDTAEEKFDAVSYSKTLWEIQLPAKLDSAQSIVTIVTALSEGKEAAQNAFEKYSSALGIGSVRYFLVKFTGQVTAINEDDINLSIQGINDSSHTRLATEFVYGNAIRDASALVNIKDFTNAMDLNNISEALNKKVRTEVLPTFKSIVKKGDTIEGVGAIEINSQHLSLDDIEIIPIRLKVLP